MSTKMGSGLPPSVWKMKTVQGRQSAELLSEGTLTSVKGEQTLRLGRKWNVVKMALCFLINFQSQLGYKYLISILHDSFLKTHLQAELEKIGYREPIDVSLEKWNLPNLPEGGAGPMMGNEEKVLGWLAEVDSVETMDVTSEGDSGLPEDVSSVGSAWVAEQLASSLPMWEDLPTESGASTTKRVILINDEYGTSHAGEISTINRQLALLLRENNADVHCTALNATEKDRTDASKDEVKFHLPRQLSVDTNDSDSNERPCLLWVTKYHTVRYPHLPKDVDCTVGHVDSTDKAKAARCIKESRYSQAQLILFNHDIPEDTEVYKGAKRARKAPKKEGTSVTMAENAHAIFSIGKRVHNHFERKYSMLGISKPKTHVVFLPKPSIWSEAPDMQVKPGIGQKVVLSIGSVVNQETLKGYDIAGRALAAVAERIPGLRWYVRGISEDDWETTREILERHLKSTKLRPTLLPCGTQSDIQHDLMVSHLFLMPSRSEPFGLDALEAIAAGIPVLISDQSGLADLIMELITKKKCHPDRKSRIVSTSTWESFVKEDAKTWAEKILDTLNYIEAEFDKADQFKKELYDSRYWEESHRDVLEACGITAESVP